MNINIGGRLMSLAEPKVMGILNVTSDSFYAESRCESRDAVEVRVRQIRDEGAGIVDIGACSTRPGAEPVSEQMELERLLPAIEVTLCEWPEAVICVDTFRSSVAREAIKSGAHIINDVSGGEVDEKMFLTVAELHVPYVLCSCGTFDIQCPFNAAAPCYGIENDDVMIEVFRSLGRKVEQLHELGVADIILDPGFGFGKTLEQNYEVMNRLGEFQLLECPILVGVSRKSMIYNLLDTTQDEALNGTTVLNTVALMKGASILRVHDVRAAVEAVMLLERVKNADRPTVNKLSNSK